MPLIHSVPVAMSALNCNIDESLTFTDTHNYIRKVDASGSLTVAGGRWTGMGAVGALLRLFGKDAAGGNILEFELSNIGESAQLRGAYFGLDGSNEPMLAMDGHRISDVAEVTTDKDAVRYNAWADWTPSFTWTGGTPTITTSEARWTRLGKVAFFWVTVVASDGNNVSALTISLPVAAKASLDTGAYEALTGYEYVNGTKTDPFARILYNVATPNISFGAWSTWTDNVQCQIWVSGFYEVA